MKHKTLTIIFGMVLLIGILGMVGAERIISNLDETINIPVEVIAGNTFQGDFSFDYLSIPDNEDNSPLIIKLDLTSDDQINYPVWKDDFEINGYVDKCTWTILGVCILPHTIYFNCSEDAPLTIVHAIGSETINSILDGTFYCYNEEADLKLDEHDEVFLNIKSNPALYPGTYELTANLYYLSDTYPPFVNITNKDDFENKYYRENDNFNIQALVEEGGEISNVWGTVYLHEENISFYSYDDSSGTYYFSQMTPSDIQEGNYSLKIFAEDTEGNIGEDYTTLRIDRTPPMIILIQPTEDEVYSGMMSIEFNVTDEKAGVKDVTYRLKEMDENNNICPIGIGSWSCYDSGWVTLNYNTTTRTFKDEIDTTEIGLNGRYWLQAKACDKLGNCREFDPADEK